MNFNKLLIFGVLLGSFFVLLSPDDAGAITAWARKYDVSCSACHSTGYRLNRDGIDFQRRGHYFAKDDPSKDLSNYVAFNTKIRFNDGNDSDLLDNKVGESTFEFHAFAFYGGGLLYRSEDARNNYAFFTELYFHEREGTLNKTDTFGDGGRTKLAEAYFQYTRGVDNYFTVRVGQIASQLWYYQGAGGRVAETRNFLVNNTTITTNAGVPNKWLPRMRDYGIEAGGQYGDLHAVVGIENGNGNSPTNTVENKGQSAKDFYTQFDYTVADKAMLGLYYYNGTLQDPTGIAQPNGSFKEDNFYRFGLTANVNPNDHFWLLASYLYGKDDDSIPAPGFNAAVNSSGFALEADYTLNQSHEITPFVRYDYFTQDGKSGAAGTVDTNTNAFVLGCSFGLFQENRGRVVVEWQLLKQEEKAAITKDLIDDQNLRVELSFML